jgi:transcriptional regulator with XRE-family HTH domain
MGLSERPREPALAGPGDPGLVVRSARVAQGLTLAQLGTRCCLSASQVSRYETGRSRPDMAVLRAFATALGIPPQQLGLAGRLAMNGGREEMLRSTVAREPLEDGGDPVRRRELLTVAGLAGVAVVGAPAVRAAIPKPDGLSRQLERVLLDPGSHVPVPVAELEGTLRAAQAAFSACHYEQVAALLPGLAAGAHDARDAANGRTRDRLTTVAAGAYGLTSEMCVKTGEDAMAWVAADRALTVARTGGDPATVAAATRTMAISMRRAGHREGATRLLTDTANGLGVGSGDPPPQLLALYGSMLCTAAYSSAQAQHAAHALDLIDEAASAAARMRGVRPAGPAFTIDTVEEYKIGIHTVLGNSGQALTAARQVRQQELPTAERHARFCVDLARAWALHGRADRATEALLCAGRHAPEEVRRRSVQDLVAQLLQTKSAPGGLRSLVQAGRDPVQRRP